MAQENDEQNEIASFLESSVSQQSHQSQPEQYQLENESLQIGLEEDDKSEDDDKYIRIRFNRKGLLIFQTEPIDEKQLKDYSAQVGRGVIDPAIWMYADSVHYKQSDDDKIKRSRFEHKDISWLGKIRDEGAKCNEIPLVYGVSTIFINENEGKWVAVTPSLNLFKKKIETEINEIRNYVINKNVNVIINGCNLYNNEIINLLPSAAYKRFFINTMKNKLELKINHHPIKLYKKILFAAENKRAVMWNGKYAFISGDSWNNDQKNIEIKKNEKIKIYVESSLINTTAFSCKELEHISSLELADDFNYKKKALPSVYKSNNQHKKFKPSQNANDCYFYSESENKILYNGIYIKDSSEETATIYDVADGKEIEIKKSQILKYSDHYDVDYRTKFGDINKKEFGLILYIKDQIINAVYNENFNYNPVHDFICFLLKEKFLDIKSYYVDLFDNKEQKNDEYDGNQKKKIFRMESKLLQHLFEQNLPHKFISTICSEVIDLNTVHCWYCAKETNIDEIHDNQKCTTCNNIILCDIFELEKISTNIFG